jgi:beta-lactamase class A
MFGWRHFTPVRIGWMGLLSLGEGLGCKQQGSTPTGHAEPTPPTPAAQIAAALGEVTQPLEARLGELAVKAGGKVRISVIHVESGQIATVGGQPWIPLQSVFKLPLAVAVLHDVHAGHASLDQRIAEIARTAFNSSVGLL